MENVKNVLNIILGILVLVSLWQLYTVYSAGADMALWTIASMIGITVFTGAMGKK